MPRSGPEYGDDLRQGVDYFEVLGVDEAASAEEVISAFRAKIRAVHPDVNEGKHDPEAVGRIARARKTLTGADREAYVKARQAQREAPRPQPSTASPTPAASAASGDAWDIPEDRAWQRAADEVRRRAEAEARGREESERAARTPRAARPTPDARPSPGARAGGGASQARATDESPRPRPSPESASSSQQPAAPRSTPRPFERDPLIPPFPAGRRTPMPPRRVRPTADEILQRVQRRSAEILDEARWRSDDALAEAQRKSREILDASRRRSSETLREAQLEATPSALRSPAPYPRRAAGGR